MRYKHTGFTRLAIPGLLSIALLLNSCDAARETENDHRETGTISDYDGNTYNTVRIGRQWWMAENLRSTHYADATEIPLVENDSAWFALTFTDKAFCYYKNDSTNANTFSALYTWAAAMNGENSRAHSGVQGVCPNGWRLPSDDDWKELEMYLGMRQIEADVTGWRGKNEGDKLKAAGGWLYHGNGTNSSGFTALPGGYRLIYGDFNNLGKSSMFWSATEFSDVYAWCRSLYYDSPKVSRGYYYKDNGFCVRCIKDE